MAEDAVPGISIVEQMAAKHHEQSGTPIRWEQLSSEDRLRLMDRMEAAVRSIPDKLILKKRTATETCRTGQARDAILSDHDQAKGSVLYGR